MVGNQIVGQWVSSVRNPSTAWRTIKMRHVPTKQVFKNLKKPKARLFQTDTSVLYGTRHNFVGPTQSKHELATCGTSGESKSRKGVGKEIFACGMVVFRSEEHTSELQS